MSDVHVLGVIDEIVELAEAVAIAHHLASADDAGAQLRQHRADERTHDGADSKDG